MKPKNKLTPSSPTTTRTQTKTQKTPKTHLKTHLNFTKNPKYIIPILLSSLKTPQNPSSFSTIKHCLTKLLHLIHPSSPLQCVQPHINTILALLPLLLHLHYNGLVGTVAKIVGCLSLFSMEVNGMIAGDKEVLKGLSLKVVTCEKWAVNKDVVNALLDVCVSCNGRESLVEVGGLDYLMLGSLQVKGAMEYSNSIDIMEKDGELCLGVESCQDELQLLFLNAVVTLTNFCSTEQLQQIPNKLSEAFFRYEKEIWFHIHKRLLGTNFTTYSQGKCSYLSSITAYNLAESIFRLSMYAPGVTCSVPSQIIVGHMFGRESSGYQKFMSDHWEASPFLISRQSTEMDVPLDIFSSFMGSLAGEESVAHFPSSLIEGMVSCPPIALDELDILGFLNDVKDTLGCPIMYQQDIRVVKTFSHSKTEKHYFQESSKKGIEVPKSFCAEDIEKCEAAFREGYTIALRGMEYRLKGIAAMTRVIAALFGQPSVGANLYVTPPNSQGLACHYDDHCVFVCQLHGTKQWTVYLQPIVQLPRLYEHLDVPEELLMEKREILLREGDILYIPRGLAHEACTITDPTPSADHSECSTHLTLAIEIEPPFEIIRWCCFRD